MSDNQNTITQLVRDLTADIPSRKTVLQARSDANQAETMAGVADQIEYFLASSGKTLADIDNAVISIKDLFGPKYVTYERAAYVAAQSAAARYDAGKRRASRPDETRDQAIAHAEIGAIARWHRATLAVRLRVAGVRLTVRAAECRELASTLTAQAQAIRDESVRTRVALTPDQRAAIREIGEVRAQAYQAAVEGDQAAFAGVARAEAMVETSEASA